uniref:Uncharacterized protein n=1 Tax=Jakoba libera TaxID=143017 RepID=M4QLD1_JAKLI|nr:hypothetical protein L048_p008 [Jakoba libera]AGH24248.1 hypothetical protein [Jakoba libera]
MMRSLTILSLLFCYSCLVGYLFAVFHLTSFLWVQNLNQSYGFLHDCVDFLLDLSTTLTSSSIVTGQTNPISAIALDTFLLDDLTRSSSINTSDEWNYLMYTQLVHDFVNGTKMIKTNHCTNDYSQMISYFNQEWPWNDQILHSLGELVNVEQEMTTHLHLLLST